MVSSKSSTRDPRAAFAGKYVDIGVEGCQWFFSRCFVMYICINFLLGPYIDKLMQPSVTNT